MNRTWGYSSAGRALEWHSRGQRFDPAYLHQGKVLKLQGFRDFFFFRCGQQNRPISNSYLTVSGVLSGGEQTPHFTRFFPSERLFLWAFQCIITRPFPYTKYFCVKYHLVNIILFHRSLAIIENFCYTVINLTKTAKGGLDDARFLGSARLGSARLGSDRA